MSPKKTHVSPGKTYASPVKTRVSPGNRKGSKYLAREFGLNSLVDKKYQEKYNISTMDKRTMGVTLILVTLLSLQSFAQRFNFRNYSLEEGLAQSQVYYVFQDSKGYLWCATSGGGVSRFDGANFVNFTRKDGLADNIVFFITEDRAGSLWFGTDKGVTRYDGRLFTSFTTDDGLKDDCVWTILEDNKGNLWIGTYTGGVNKFDGKTFINYTEKDGLCHDRVFAIIQDSKDNFWLGTLKGLSKFDGSTFVNYTKKNGLPDDNVRHILEDSKGNLWFATKGGVSKYNGKTFTRYTTEDGLSHNIVNFVLEDRKGRLWFATEGGVSEYNGSAFTSYTTKNGLCHDFVQSICEDREGNLWFGTDLGLSRYSGKMFAFLSTADGLPDDVIWGIWQDSEGIIWLSTEKGLFKYYEKGYRVVPVEEIPKTASAFPFFEDRKGNLWFAVAASIYKYDGKRFTRISAEEKFDEHEVFSIYEDRLGNMWFGTQEGGVIKYDGKTFVKFTTEQGLANNSVNAVIEDKFGNLVFGTDGGISIYNNQTFTNITPNEGVNTRYTLSLVSDREDNLWIGTFGGGVIKYTPARGIKTENFETFTSKDGLSDDEVLLLVFDDSGFLYIGTNKGINKLDVKEFNKTGKKLIRHYGKSEGFLGIECQQNAVYKDREGNLWFGTVRGAVKYNPGEETLNLEEPLTSIRKLKLFHEEVDLAEYSKGIDSRSGLPIALELPHTKNYLTFDYVAISLTAPEKVNYRVKLEGFDENWTPVTKTTFATYSNLPPGGYTFKVKACNNNGIWNKNPTAFHFRIIAPFWQRWWFVLSSILVVILLVNIGVKVRTRSLEKQRQILEDLVKERTLELKKEKAKVEQINLELEQRVRERTEKLIDANKQLMQAQRMEVIGTMAGGVAHDLNNVLVGVVSLPDLLLKKVPEGDFVHKYLLKIKKSGERAAAIVQDLLALGRRGVTINEVVDLNSLVLEYLKSQEFEKLKSDYLDIKVETQLQEDLSSIMGSPVHLARGIMNLVDNAAAALMEGGRILVKTENCRLEQHPGFDPIDPGEYVSLSVSDTGAGISAEDTWRIFEPFYTRRQMGKSGVGLRMAVVWGIVKDHNGHIEVRSAEGVGTTIVLYFPTTTRIPVDEKTLEARKDEKGRGEDILVVDDEENQREIATLILTKLGYHVIPVASGEEAVRYLESHSVHLVMLDMVMDPGIDGCETYQRIIKLHPGQKTIIVSGFSEDERVKKAQQLGAGAFISKPYLIKEIGQAIKNELER